MSWRRTFEAGRRTKIHTRFPPEPNGYLHIGHAKSICLNFGIAHEFGGVCNMRMDDTNPTKEEAEYVDSIMADVHWLIDGWADTNLGGAPFYASDYFDQLYEYAVELVRKGKAYVDDMTPEETDEYRGIGKESPFRNRAVEENLDLLRAHEGRRISRRRADIAREDRHERAEHVAARSGALSHSPRRTSSHRRQVVHLSDVRFRAMSERLHRRHHALDLHARVRGASAALRLDSERARAAAAAAAPIRIRAAQSQLHGDEQAQAHPARERETGERLG